MNRLLNKTNIIKKNESKTTLMELDGNLTDLANETADLLNNKVQLITHTGY
jgi:hypothetical protein